MLLQLGLRRPEVKVEQIVNEVLLRLGRFRRLSPATEWQRSDCFSMIASSMIGFLGIHIKF
jgi:hypothetical protein